MAALFYGVASLALLALVAGLGQSLAKVSLDATIQRDVHERIQASAFARSDTTLQLAWVIGGFVGIAMPLNPQLGLGIGTAVLAGVDGVRPGHPTGQATGKPAPRCLRRPPERARPQDSSSSARARSSFATGLAVRESGCRPWR